MRPLVFTNGVFDILHRGHVEYLEAASKLGTLVVGLNSDDSARRLGKGRGRPVNSQADRMAVLQALRCVQRVVVFDEDKPLNLMRALVPDVYVKGGDYDMSQLAEAALMESWGGKAIAMPFVRGYSSSAMLERLQR